ncbi:unnamed protein product [Ixodes hexagonus]
MTERRVSVRELARELEARAARDHGSPTAVAKSRLHGRLGLTRADSEPGADGARGGTCHCCAQPSSECLCGVEAAAQRLAVPHVPRKKVSAPAITPLRESQGPLASLDEGSSCADVRLAWQALCCRALGPGPEASSGGAISEDSRDENSGAILVPAAQGDSAGGAASGAGPLDAILRSLEHICSQLEQQGPDHGPVMLPDAGEAASRLNSRCARSQPSSPRVRAKPQLPAYLTLARRARDDALEIEQIKSILASIDFSRYRKKRAAAPQATADMASAPEPPPPPPTAGGDPSATTASRLRELTEKLKSPVGAPGRPSDTWNRRPAVHRSASFSTSDLPTCPPARETLTLPRKAATARPSVGSTTTTAAVRGSAAVSRTSPAARTVLDDVAVSSLSLDSAVESFVDETAYQRDASPPAADRRGRVPQRSGCRFAPIDDDGTRGPPQPPEKRKRRKGLAPVEGPKKETGRSLTYPPQRKTAEQELAFSSVDSNGLKSLGGRPEKQPSDLSLADSHFCPSEALGETFGDVVQSLSSRPEQRSEQRQETKCKKKHLSDPSADNTGASVELPELLLAGCCRSEPQLSCPAALHKRQHSGPAALSRAPPAPLSDSERATSDTERTCSPQRRYSKKRLRGPYGEMLEEEMRKSGEKQKTAFCEDLSFLLSGERQTTTTQAVQQKQQQQQPSQQQEPRSRPSHLSNSLSLDDTQLKGSSSLEAVPEAALPRRKISANYPLTGADTSQFLMCDSDHSDAASKESSVSWLPRNADVETQTPVPSPVPPSPRLQHQDRHRDDERTSRAESAVSVGEDSSPLRSAPLRRPQVSDLCFWLL